MEEYKIAIAETMLDRLLELSKEMQTLDTNKLSSISEELSFMRGSLTKSDETSYNKSCLSFVNDMQFIIDKRIGIVCSIIDNVPSKILTQDNVMKALQTLDIKK